MMQRLFPITIVTLLTIIPVIGLAEPAPEVQVAAAAPTVQTSPYDLMMGNPAPRSPNDPPGRQGSSGGQQSAYDLMLPQEVVEIKRPDNQNSQQGTSYPVQQQSPQGQLPYPQGEQPYQQGQQSSQSGSMPYQQSSPQTNQRPEFPAQQNPSNPNRPTGY